MAGSPYRPMRLGCLLTLLLVACDSGGTPPAPAGPAGIAYPLSVSDGGRALTDSLGRPVLLHGEAAWSLVANLTLEDAVLYLDDRRAKGVNAVYVNLVETAFTDQDPPWLNAYADPPFDPLPDTYVMDFSAPREAYWAHVDAVLAAAAARDILVFAFPAYMGWKQQFDGWSYALDANGPERMRAYGEFLGARYARQPNLVWAAGGDWAADGPSYAVTDEVTAYVEGLRSRDAAHLWTGHGGQQSGAEAYGHLGLDLNTTYRYPPEQVPEAVRADAGRSPRLPTLFFEGWYENEYGVTGAQLRYQAYTSLLGGAVGQFYGNNPIWLFGPGWKEALDDPGALDQVRLGRLFRSRPFHPWLPDDSGAVALGDRGGLRDGTYVAAARARGGQASLVYVPGDRSVEVDLDRAVEADAAHLWCVDPQTGRATDLGVRPARGRYLAAPCAGPDWILVVDDAALGLGPPGG